MNIWSKHKSEAAMTTCPYAPTKLQNNLHLHIKYFTIKITQC